MLIDKTESNVMAGNTMYDKLKITVPLKEH